VTAVRDDGQQLSMRNFSSYNYLGFGTHPEVIAAAKDALDRYGLGAASSPVASGTLSVHRQLEHAIVDFLGVPDRAATLFSSGYGVNTGTLSAFVHQGHHVVLDRSAHVSLLEGAQLARADLHYFRHNDPDHLDRVLSRITDDGGDPRVLVCTEGLFSADGDRGRIAEISAVCRRHGAFLLVDEAHSILVAGDDGRGVAAEQGVLDQVDLLVLTFSKGLGGVGGALVARPEIIAYVNWYARCRMFSCALDPAVTGGVLQGFRLGASDEGHARRRRLHDNARYLRQRLSERLDVLPGDSWIVPVPFGDERLTVPLADHLQRRGLDVSIMQFPAVPKGESRVRLFVTAEHDRDDLDACVEVMCSAAERFGFAREEAPCATSS
jgi:glycine C-acetyltransferase